MMKKTTKGALAAGGAAALLLGVGGTFAQWSESTEIGAGEVQAGQLDWTVSSGVWTDVTDAQPAAISNITAFRMVPGDTVQYKATVTPTLVGDNLTATLTADVASPTGELADNVQVTAAVGGGGNDVQLSPADSGEPIPVTVTISFPFAATDGETESLDLSSLTLDLVQNTNPVP